MKAFPDDDSPRSDDLESLRQQLAFELGRALTLRWSDYLGLLAVIDELSETLGERLVHPGVDELLDPVRRKLLELHEVLCLRGETFRLPERDEAGLAKFREWIHWDRLKEPEAVAADKPKPWRVESVTCFQQCLPAEYNQMMLLALRSYQLPIV